MTRREIREEIFKLLFEHELIDNNIEKRINDVINEENLKKNDEIEFLRNYVTEIIENENILIEKIKNILDGWTYERLGTIEKVLLKISFYEITIKDVGYEIAINEVLEIAKKYSYNDTKEFLNGILAKLVKNIKEEKHK
jgi:transcription antitermination factor nusB